MVNKTQLTYNAIINVLDIRYFPSERTDDTLPPGIYEIVDFNLLLKFILPDSVKVSVTIDDSRLKSNINLNQTLIFTEKLFLYIFRLYSITFLSFRLY